MKWQRYLKMKDSGIEWIGEIPEHWKSIRLKYHISEPLKYGANEAAELDDPKLPRFVRITDINEDGKLRSDTFKSLPIEIARPYYLKQGDLLLARSGATVGKTFLYDKSWGNAAFAGYLIRARMKNNSILPNFIAYYCRSTNYWSWLQNSYIQATIQNVSAEKYSGLIIPTPSLKEQQTIASFLDRKTKHIDTLIVKKECQIELLQEKRSALISHAVTKGLNPKARMKDSGIEWLGEIPEHWEVKTIRRVSKTVKTGGTPLGAAEMYFDENGFNWYTPGDFNEDVFLGESARKLSEIGKKEVRVFPAMTVMTIGIGATIGKVALSREPSSCNQQINAIICNPEMNPKFLTYFLRIMRDYIYRCGKFTTLPIINQEDTKALIIICPPLFEQDYIVSVLDQESVRTDALVSKVHMSIDKLREYRTALISATVTGKIDIRKEAA